MITITWARLKAIWPWLLEPRYAWISLSVIILALAVAFGPLASERAIRMTGLVLQLLGIATVAWGISETRALFGHPSFARKTRDWLTRFPLLRRTHVLEVEGISTAAMIGRARAYGTHRAAAPTLEARVDALEKNIVEIHDRITQTQKEVDEGFAKGEDALKGEAQARQTEDNAIRQKLEATGTGGVHISAIGASWLFIGVVLSSASVELAKMVT